MIAGIGIDLVEISRVERMLAAYGDRFVERVLTPVERDDYRGSTKQAWFLGGRFAAKEALSKALGTGLRFPVTLQAISVIRDDRGRPGLRFGETLAGHLQHNRIARVHLSITHEKDLACAIVVLESQS
ncbi:MAG TPA: holo-ACP synthase [Burkholderiales bacterium]|jgi:holo-[acyl-carrier protein] synthase|nr:holo-ACP synthase [Burkholderiales bacterium]